MADMKTTTPGDLRRLASTYTARAQPVADPEADEEERPETEVDVRIETKLHKAVKLVADRNRQELTAVARAILFRTAARVTPAQIQRYEQQRKTKVADAIARATKRARSRGFTDEQVQAAADRAAQRVQRQRLPLRDYGQERYRLRFTVPTEAYIIARDAIQASGRSVAVAVEEGLYEYAHNQRIS